MGMKVGFYKDDLEIVQEDDSVIRAAEDYAEAHHEIHEQSDMEFVVYVEDLEGQLHEVKMFTDYDPRYEVAAVKKVV